VLIGYLVRKPEGRTPLDVGVGGRALWNWILEQQGGAMWTELIWLNIGTMSGLL
jgi:hypothetical protein